MSMDVFSICGKPLLTLTYSDFERKLDAGGVDGAVAQHIRQLHDVPGDPIEGGRKQVAQVVRENF